VAGILGDLDPLATCCHLDEILRLRAVSGQTPSEALSFVFELRHLLEEAFGAERQRLLALERRLDQVSLFAFDVYTRCREEVFHLRLRELSQPQPSRGET
jgi:hypothetical protein